MKIDK